MLNGWIFVLILSLVGSSHPQDIGEIQTRIDQFVNELMDCYGIPGAIVSAVRDNEVITAKGYGVKNMESGEPVTNRTLFIIASVTKQFVSAVIGKILQKHNYTFDTPVRTILGDWFYFKDPYRTAKVTVRDLLAHRTGLPRNDRMRVYNYTVRQMFEKIRHLDFTADIRSLYKYNNLMYGLAGYIGTVLEGKSWEDLCREHVYQPLGMTDSTFVHQARDRWDEFATPYNMFEGLPREMSLEHPSTFYMTISAPGGISSNAVDMAKWLLLHIHKGQNTNGTRVFDSELLESTYEQSMPRNSNPLFLRPFDPVTFTSGESYALGFSNGYHRGYSMIEHSGSQGGYLSLLNILRDKNIGIFTSVSIGSRNRFRAYVHIYIHDLLLGKEPFLNTTNACPGGIYGDMEYGEDQGEEEEETEFTYKDIQKRSKTPSLYPEENTIGTYHNFAYGDVIIYRNTTDQELYMSYGPVTRYELLRIGEDLTFTGLATLPLWSLRVGLIEFKECDGEPCREVTVNFEPEAPPVFYRNPGPEPAPVPPCPSG